VALDFETTGLDPRVDHVVSFGTVVVRDGRVVLDTARYAEASPPSWPSHRSVPIHQLRPADLAVAPPVAETSRLLADALRGRVLLCWAAAVEAAFLDTLFGGGARRWHRRSIDVRRMTARLEADRGRNPDLRLTSVAERYDVPVDRPHHALGDALMTAQLFLVMATKLEPLGYGTTGRLLRLTR
jgi:DNA polymerase-3 subunit epsilon